MLKSVNGVLKEELSRLRAAERSYVREIKRLPKGSIQKKKISGKVYPYLNYRKGSKVVSKYLGNLSKEELRSLSDTIALRRNYSDKLKEVRENIVNLERMISSMSNK